MLADNKELKLNDRQEAILNHISGALLVLAPAGTGKTVVLAERAAKAIANGIEPARILCLTFTNRAAREMSERVKKRYPEYSSKMTISTFHGLCAHMLYRESKAIGLPHDFVIYDEEDSKEVIQDIGSLGLREASDLYHEIGRIKSKAIGELLSTSSLMGDLFQKLGRWTHVAIEYQKRLMLNHALDFQDLVFRVRVMLKEHEAIKNRWTNRFDFIQVDEVQDTHLSEYEVVKALSQSSGNLCLIGDFAQTIYEWRGSAPRELIRTYEKDFDPVSILSLRENYRATRVLLQASNALARTFKHGSDGYDPAETVEEGEPIVFHRAENGFKEAVWISRQIERLYQANPDLQFYRVGILTRTNSRGVQISEVLERMGIPHVTVEEYRFFSRQEVKDALAHLKVLINPRDRGSLIRMLRRTGKGIGEKTINHINGHGPALGLFLSDMIFPSSFEVGDPFGRLFEAAVTGSIVVFDVETTGLDTQRDDVVEIAAQRIERGRVVDEFHALLRNTVPVGESELVHGYSDAFLESHGVEPKDGFDKFFQFAAESVLVGHNIHSFDIPIVSTHAKRLGLPAPESASFDTLDIAQRFVKSHGYDLWTLKRTLHLSHNPTHKAMDDVRCTKDLLFALLPLAKEQSSLRRALVLQYAKVFQPLSRQVAQWKDQMARLRPGELLTHVLIDSGLEAFYKRQPKRLANLDMLKQFFIEKENVDLSPQSALPELLRLTTIARNIDFLSETDNRIPVITVHQAKGLEFDVVFIAGATEREFPSYFSFRDALRLEEEKRLFYVAVTRAKKRLLISSHKQNERGFANPRCRFIDLLGHKNLRMVN